MPKIAIISDFAKTLTASSNPTTWSVFAKSGLLGKKYIEERNDFFKKFHNFELIGDIKETKQWWREHLNLFIKHGLTNNIIKNIVRDEKYFKPREGLVDFFNFSTGKYVDIMIVSSSGISNFIKEFLNYNNIDTTNISIIGNTLNMDNEGKAISYEDDIITTLNKNENNLDLSRYEKVILLGDDKNDLQMYNGNNCIKIGFCSDSITGYDYYLGKTGSLNKVKGLIDL